MIACTGWMRRLLLPLLLVLVCVPALAVIETYEFDNDSLRERFKHLSQELRCPKCQNQNIADSNAPIAADLRKQLHDQLHQGRSDEEIVEFMVDRYGDFVLYRPRVNRVTLVLWLAPVILLALALLVLRASFKGRAAADKRPELSPEEQAKLDALLAEDKRGERQ